MENKNLPIGVFDSGLGGLTVLKEITTLLPGESTIYIGDTARVPYGNKSSDTVKRYSLEITAKLTEMGVKAIVVACNTASAYALEHLKSQFDLPLIGVISPGAQKAASVTKTKKIGVIGTDATIKSGAYMDSIKSIDSGLSVTGQPCPLFVPLAEEGWTDNPAARLIAEEYLKPFYSGENSIDTLVLGCTHYPLLKGIISNIMGSNVSIVDSATATAEALKALLGEKGLINTSGGKPEYTFFSTDSTERFTEVGKSFFGHELTEVALIDL